MLEICVIIVETAAKLSSESLFKPIFEIIQSSLLPQRYLNLLSVYSVKCHVSSTHFRSCELLLFTPSFVTAYFTFSGESARNISNEY